MQRRLGLASVCALAIALVAAAAVAQRRSTPHGYAMAEDEDLRFVLHDRPVKVVVLAGSIGAYPDMPYARLLHQWCGRAEIRNLSAVGQGSYQLYERFRERVLEAPRMPLGVDGVEMWLLYHGGMNSVGNPTLTNRYIRSTFVLAHRRGVRVAALSLTPWGEDDDAERWAGTNALRSLRNTRTVVDFVLGRLAPREALGELRVTREVEPDHPWVDRERPDIAIDVYDSRLHDRDAETRDVERMRAMLARDSRWRRSVEGLDERAREERLSSDARLLADAPRWWMRHEYRGFDDVHPNRDGHYVIAQTACPRLPESWGCACPPQ